MRGQILFRTTLSVTLLLLVAGSNLVRGSADLVEAESASSSGNPGAAAPWFMDEVDTEGDMGLHASVAYDPASGVIYASYYDATNQELRLARSNGFGPEPCGPDGEWRKKAPLKGEQFYVGTIEV